MKIGTLNKDISLYNDCFETKTFKEGQPLEVISEDNNALNPRSLIEIGEIKVWVTDEWMNKHVAC